MSESDFNDTIIALEENLLKTPLEKILAITIKKMTEAIRNNNDEIQELKKRVAQLEQGGQ